MSPILKESAPPIIRIDEDDGNGNLFSQALGKWNSHPGTESSLYEGIRYDTPEREEISA